MADPNCQDEDGDHNTNHQLDVLQEDITELKRLEKLSVLPSIQKYLRDRWHELELSLILMEDDELEAANPECIMHHSNQTDTNGHPVSNGNTESNNDIQQPAFNKPNNLLLTSYAWSQEDDLVQMFVSEELAGIGYHDRQLITCSFTSRSLRLEVHDFEGRNFQLVVTDLFDDILPSECKFKLKRDQIVIYLRKCNPVLTWSDIHSPNKTSSNNQNNKSGEEREVAMALLETMYEEADFDTRQTMAAAYRDTNHYLGEKSHVKRL